MALTDENNGGIGATMLVGPATLGNTTGYALPYPYPMTSGNSGFGNGDWSWIIILLLFGLFGNGFGGMGGFVGMGGLYPWLNQSNQSSDGFQNAQLQDSVTSVRDGISALSTQLCGCCGDMQMSLANGFAGTTAAITGAQNALSQQLYTNELASLNRSFAEQTANTAGFTGLNSGIADLRYTVATEACADRAAVNDALKDVLAANTASTQRILDQLCQDKIDAKNEKIADLERQLTMANLAASQTAQTANIRAGQVDAVSALVNELRSCPIPAQPVYGSQSIFTCPNNSGCGCGGGTAF